MHSHLAAPSSQDLPPLEDEQGFGLRGQFGIPGHGREEVLVHILHICADVQLGQVVRVQAARQRVVARAQLQEVRLPIHPTSTSLDQAAQLAADSTLGVACRAGKPQTSWLRWAGH